MENGRGGDFRGPPSRGNPTLGGLEIHAATSSELIYPGFEQSKRNGLLPSLYCAVLPAMRIIYISLDLQ